MTADAPAFSVVIPAHNAAATLRSCLRSVLAQSEAGFEVVVVDDGSSDGSVALARSFTDPRLRVLERPAGGVSSARNAGISAARGEIVCFLDSDDLLLPRYLEVVAETFGAGPEVDFVYTDAWTFDDRTRRVRVNTTAHYQRPPRPAPATAGELLHELLMRNFIIVPVAVRRRALEEVGGFDEAIFGAEDWDLWLRLLVAGHRADEAPGPLGLRREHADQSSRDPVRMVSGRVRLFEKLLDNPLLAPEDAALVTERLAAERRGWRAVTGEDRTAALVRRGRIRLAGVKQAIGAGARWYESPPAVVTAAFGDLAELD
ncbi:MAG TPA: glycosyltransferase [Solirubrobacteraceae bacterium]|nr:glycosyltransferase [Solirubrobacteraceae bacterium]